VHDNHFSMLKGIWIASQVKKLNEDAGFPFVVLTASAANVKHFILVTSLGTAKFGWPASILNLFWGVLIWKAKAEKALKESGIPYTVSINFNFSLVC
jgi:uncharacterized protein YbjT (DUF2867 family)